MTAEPPPESLDEHVHLARNPSRFDGGRAGHIANAICGVGVLGLLAVVWVGRIDHAPPSWLIGMVTLLPYLFMSGLAGLFSVWVLMPDSRLPPALIAVLGLSGLGLWGPGWGHGQLEAGVPVRVMSWNLRRLWGGPDDGGDALACAIEAIRAADPQVLSLQEVSAADVAALSKSLPLSCAHTTYLPGGGDSKGGLASCSVGNEWRLKSGTGQRFAGEDWRYVFSELQRGDEVFNLLTVHLHPYELGMRKWIEVTQHGEAVQQAQSDQTAQLLERVAKFADPTLVAGDFNSTRDAALHVSLRRDLFDSWERGGAGFGGTVKLMGVAPLRVDYIYATGDFGSAGALVADVGCSDHQPVIADLVLRRP